MQLGYSQAVRQLALNQSFREFESLYPSHVTTIELKGSIFLLLW